MNDSPLFEFEQAIYSALKNSENLAKEIKNIYSYLPTNAGFPYIYLGTLNFEDKSAKTCKIYNLSKQINIYSSDPSPLKLYKISDIVLKIFDKPLNLINFDAVITGSTIIRAKKMQIGEQNIFTANFNLKFLIGEKNYD